MINEFAKIIELEEIELQVLVTKKFDKLPAIRVETECEGNRHSVVYHFCSEIVRDLTFDSYNERQAHTFIKEHAHFK